MARRRAAIFGLIAVALLWSWQFLTVRYNYDGNWSALFRIASHMPVPDFLKSEPLYIFQGVQGYDGQVYHLIAHDPWMRKGSPAAIAGASFRYQRILVPALAWMLAFGSDERIHAAYILVVLAFAFLGVYWLSLVASRAGLNPAWGLVFVLTPATVTSIDRLTADIALAALVAGFAWFVEGPVWKTAIVLACALLTRETAVLIVGGYLLYLLTQKRIADFLITAAGAIPAGAWFLMLSRRAEPSPVPSYLSFIPLGGFVERIAHPVMYMLPPLKTAISMACDYLSLAGVVLALVFAARLGKWTAQAAAVYALAIAAIFIESREVWTDANAFGRVLTPLLLLSGLQYLRRPWLAFAPLFLVDTRLSLDLWSQVAGVARGFVR